MRTPPYPCAFCGKVGLPHPLMWYAQCVECATAELEAVTVRLRRGRRAALVLVGVTFVVLAVLVVLKVMAG